MTLLLTFGCVGATIASVVFFALWQRAKKEQLSLIRQIEQLQGAEAKLKTQAYMDHLTGLANRALWENRCQSAIERSKRSQNPFAILMIDLDRFKEINDNHGHTAGDQVLATVAQRLVSAVRASDTVARFGGDEFVLLIESVGDRHELTRIGQKLIDALSQRVTLESGTDVSVGGSIGFAVFPVDGSSVDDMLEVADQAMYRCKTSGLMPLF